MNSSGGIVICESGDGQIGLDGQLDSETVQLNQAQMAGLLERICDIRSSEKVRYFMIMGIPTL